MAHQNCGRFRGVDGTIYSPPYHELGPERHDMSPLDKTNRVWVPWMRELFRSGKVRSTACACDPHHPHRPKDS